MDRNSRLPAILSSCLLGIVASTSRADTPPELFSGVQTQIDTHFESDGIFRNRITASVDSPIGPLSAFVVEDCLASKLRSPVLGLATPAIDLGPLREGGLIGELNHPFGLGSIRERSRVVLDRVVGGAVAPGGVVRLDAPATDRTAVEFYAFRRAGTAPPETSTGGVTCRSLLPGGIEADLAAKITSFGPHLRSGEWLMERPAVNVPVVVRGGARLSGRLDDFQGNLSSGVALTDRLRPAAFCSGFIGFSKSLRVVTDQRPQSTPLSLSARVDGGLADPNYYGDDGRFVLKTALLHPVLAARLPGLRAAGSYCYTIYRLPLLPARNRRTVHEGGLSLGVEFGRLSVGSRWQPRLEYTERGRVLFREVSGLDAQLLFGALSIGGEIGFRHSNESPDELEAGLSLEARGAQGMFGCALKLREGTWTLSADTEVDRGRGTLQIGIAVADLFSSDPAPASGAPFRGWEEALSRVEVTVRWQVRSR